MFTKKLISLGLAVLISVTSVTIPVFAAESKNSAANKAGKKIAFNFFKPDKKEKDNKNNFKNFRFKDSDEVEWALEAIEKLAAKGILSGKTIDSFRPKDNLTEVEALAMILKLTGDSQQAERNSNTRHPLYQGKTLPWGLGYIFVAIEKKILLPGELSDFNPTAPAKRHAVAKYLIRALGKTELAKDHMDEELPFKDKNAVPKASIGYVYLVNELDLMTGNSKNEFKPMETITRAEMAVILNRADGNIELPDTDMRKSNVRFVSYNESSDTITVKVKNTNTTYKVLEGAPVFLDSKFTTIDDLDAGDMLRLIFNQNKQVIFIEVVGQNSNGDDDDEDNDTEESEIDIDEISYSSLPQMLKEQVDYLKLSKQYKAYEYNDDIYLIATRGKKNTGGYEIEINEAYKVDLGNNKYNIKAVVELDDPSANESVAQAITYPYSIVKLDDFSGIQKVVFVDEDGDRLSEANIVDLNDAVEVKGTIQQIDLDDRKIKVLKDNGTTTIYTIPTDAEIEINDSDADFEDLKTNMKVVLDITDNEVTKIEAINSITEIECILTGLSISNTKTITVKVGSSYKTYNVTSSTEVIIDDTAADLEDLTINSELTLTFQNGTLIEIEKE